MDTTWDKLRAVVCALGIHALVLGLLFVSLLSQHAPQASAAEGSIIEATLVSLPLQSATAEQAVQNALPQQPIPLPAPTLEAASQQPSPDTVASDDLSPIANPIADQKPSQDRAEPPAPSTALQTTVALPTPSQTPAGSVGDGMDLEAQYRQAIHETAARNWHHDGVPENVHCHVQFKQSPGGTVFDVVFLDCPLDPIGRTSVLEALKKTPLPYVGFESVFLPQSTLDLCYPKEACIK